MMTPDLLVEHGGRRPLLLLVDDQPRNSRLLQAQLGDEQFEYLVAESGEEALAKLELRLPDLVLLDYMMPGMSGQEVALRLKADERTRNIPIIMLTALSAGVEEFLNKPVDQTELWTRVRNLLRLKRYHDQLAEAYRDTVYTMVRAAEYKDEETGSHVQRISFFCLELAEQLGMDADFRDRIFYASPMHDIGKIGIPDAVLLKRGALDPSEWEMMKTHCTLGAEILRRGSSPYVDMGASIALHHHERWDGTGYPHGIAGTDIPLAARITMLCDQYDALRSRRPYKPPLSHEQAYQIITEGDGRTQPGHFDPDVLAAFIRTRDRFNDIYNANID